MIMPLSALRRPLFLGLILYMAVLAWLHSRGCFSADPPEELLRFRYFSAAAVQGRVCSPVKEDLRGPKVLVEGQSLRGRPFAQRLLVTLPKAADWRGLRPGLPVELAGSLRPPRPARNPGEFDERAFLHDRGVSWVMRAEGLRVLGPVPAAWLPKAWAEGARRSCQDFFERVLPPDEARVFSGLALGFKGPLRRDWNRAVQDAGAMHLLVPSGAKVAFVMLAALCLSLRLGWSPWPRFLAALLAGGFYTLMVGAEAPYTRAFWAAAALGLCRLWGRDPGAFQAMTLAAWLTLLWDPRELFGAGFQMTYAAVFGLVVAMPRLQAAARGLPRWLRGLTGVCAVSAIVQAMLWPLFANIFGRASAAGVLANIILVPASGLMMAAGFAAWLAGSWGAAADPFLGAALGSLARAFVRVCQAFASLPGAALDLSPMGPTAVLSYYLGVLSALVLPRWKASVVLAAAGLAVWAGAAAARRCAAPAVSVLLLRLPPAAPAVVSFADGRTWLVDPGTRIAAVANALRSCGVSSLDRVVLTHPWPGSAWARLRRRLPVREAARVAAPWRLCEGEVCFEFGGPEGPRVLRGEAQYSIIPGRLKLGAVWVATDGRRAEIR